MPAPGYQGRSAPDGLGEHVRTLFLEFLENFRLMGSNPEAPSHYRFQLAEMEANEDVTLQVDFNHINAFNVQFADILSENFIRVEPYMRKGVQNFVQEHIPNFLKFEDNSEKEFFITISNLPITHRLRDLKTSKLGKLVAFSGTVTRTTEVRPELFLGCFRCMECNQVIQGVEQQFRYTTPIICTNSQCGNRTKWKLERDESTFMDWQRVRVQENTDEVPAGSLPRTTDVIVRGKCVEVAKPGDKMVFTGALIVVPDVAAIRVPGERASLKSSSRGPPGGGQQGDGVTGLKSTGVQELTYRTAFMATHLQVEENRDGMVSIRSDEEMTPDQIMESFDEDAREQVEMMRSDPEVLTKLVASVAPGVYGAGAIKQAILLMLLGGVHKKTGEGISLRGDINLAIVGDPACAKSQMLKYVSSFLPRAIFTSGKASTAAGLTATVVKDADSGEFCIEAGALMLADNGICCIDEFDKMDVKDQVAIHEAMEQQTISIAKAGISATLNARASILAAANPIGGRYDRSRTLRQNIALPPAILSRFDLLHVMLDEPSEILDTHIASHILNVHRQRENAFAHVPYDTTQMQRYIKFARSIKPIITPQAKKALVTSYKELRGADAAPGTQSSYRITVRQLEALVRLSEALARAHCDRYVRVDHVHKAKKLLQDSVVRVETGDLDLDDDPLTSAREREHAEAEREHEAAAAAAEAEGAEPMEGVEQEGNENDAAAANQQSVPDPSSLRSAKETLAAMRGGAEGQEAAAEPQQPQEGAERKKTRVDARKFTFVKNLLVKALREKESEALAAALAQGGADEEVERGADFGMRQADLVNKYLEHELKRGVLKSEAELQSEFVLVERIINHLLKRDGVLIIIDRPAQQENEPQASYLARLLEERILALHPNYDPSA